MNEYSEKTDPTLVDLSLLGNSAAFEELVNRHQKKALGTAFKVTSNIWSAEDAAQDAFVSAWTHLSALEDKSRFGAWVCAITKNHACRIVRHYAAAVEVSLDLPDFPEPADTKSSDASELHEAVDSLSEALRETVKLHYFGGYKVEEIANMLGVPVGTVKWRLSEARKQLRKGYGIMEKTYDENEDFTARVMRQVEELKFWITKLNKTGFEEAYKNVLAAVESLDESDKKQYALADVLLQGYWWLDRDKEEIRERMKVAAEKSHNEDVMEAIVSDEIFIVKDEKERAEKIVSTIIPRLEAEKWVKPLGYAWFWLGYIFGARRAREDVRHLQQGVGGYRQEQHLLRDRPRCYTHRGNDRQVRVRRHRARQLDRVHRRWSAVKIHIRKNHIVAATRIQQMEMDAAVCILDGFGCRQTCPRPRHEGRRYSHRVGRRVEAHIYKRR